MRWLCIKDNDRVDIEEESLRQVTKVELQGLYDMSLGCSTYISSLDIVRFLLQKLSFNTCFLLVLLSCLPLGNCWLRSGRMIPALDMQHTTA